MASGFHDSVHPWRSQAELQSTKRALVRSRYIRGIVFAAGVMSVLGLSLAANLEHTDPISNGALEARKILLQLLLVTGLGGLIVLFLNWLRDHDAERALEQREFELRLAERIAELRDIDRDLGSVYRSLKSVKRRLRTLIITAARDSRGRAAAPYVFPAEPFRACIAELLLAQIKAEDVLDLMLVRPDLFDPEAFGEDGLRRIRDRLNYAARFIHDIVQDVERGKVIFEEDSCRAGTNCRNLDNLLNGQGCPALPAEVEQALTAYIKLESVLDDEARHAALDRIDEARGSDGEGQRFRIVADDSFNLARAEIRRGIGRMAGVTSSTAPLILRRNYAPARTLSST